LQWQLDFEIQQIPRPGGMQCIRRGPLLYALPIAARWIKHEYELKGVERKFPYCDYELFPEEPWGYGFTEGGFTYEEGSVGEFPFSESAPPCRISALMQRIEWPTFPGIENVAAPCPENISPTAPAEQKKLIPYGCTKLRMTEMPCVK
jgi:hypothetical protein